MKELKHGSYGKSRKDRVAAVPIKDKATSYD
jgi:hypothetical protein